MCGSDGRAHASESPFSSRIIGQRSPVTNEGLDTSRGPMFVCLAHEGCVLLMLHTGHTSFCNIAITITIIIIIITIIIIIARLLKASRVCMPLTRHCRRPRLSRGR
ncbi:hypothetical protein LX36DRAFT_364979 [Colletotrichum falcatum]|nr:hypothetical protein LX36DRAFT_364979 [Colletotrichum falcatum]